MIAIFLSPFYILANIYICVRALQWLSVCFPQAENPLFRLIFIGLFLFLALSVALAFILPHSKFQRMLARISTYWMGILLYSLLVLIPAELLRLIFHWIHGLPAEIAASDQTFKIVGILCIIAIIFLSLHGIIGASRVKDTSYEISLNKDGGDLNSLHIALVADLHLGYTVGVSMMRQMVNKINQLDPDIVLIAGDIFDNDYDAIAQPEELIRTLSGIKSRYGTYAVYGNHDVSEKILSGFTFPFGGKKVSDPRMDDFLQKACIRLINEETLLIDDAFYLIGRADAERPGRNVEERRSPSLFTSDLDLQKPVIVLEHEPRQLGEISESGVDLHLCGHTHDGQTFPSTLFCRLIWENSAGYLQKDNMHSIVTSGVGLFGPNMRVASKSEVVSIRVHFKR